MRPLAGTSDLDQVRPAVLTYGDRLMKTAAVPVANVAPVDLDAVAREDVDRETAGLAPRFAIPNPVILSPETDGAWEASGTGELIWRLRIASPGARSLNLGFTSYFMPGGRTTANLCLRPQPDCPAIHRGRQRNTRPTLDADRALRRHCRRGYDPGGS